MSTAPAQPDRYSQGVDPRPEPSISSPDDVFDLTRSQRDEVYRRVGLKLETEGIFGLGAAFYAVAEDLAGGPGETADHLGDGFVDAVLAEHVHDYIVTFARRVWNATQPGGNDYSDGVEALDVDTGKLYIFQRESMYSGPYGWEIEAVLDPESDYVHNAVASLVAGGGGLPDSIELAIHIDADTLVELLAVGMDEVGRDKLERMVGDGETLAEVGETELLRRYVKRYVKMPKPEDAGS